MKRIITILVAIFIVASIAQSAEKRVLMEQYTGSWCGFCVDGTVIMDDVMKANPGRVVGIKFHEGDKMQLDDGVRTHNALVPNPDERGLPSGTVDRQQWTDSQTQKKFFFLGRNNWEFCTNSILTNTAAAVEVTISWKFNEGTQKISGTITCNVLVDLAYQLAFQAIICENNVVGSGIGFDQSNYYNDDAAHPYYKLGNPIVGYVHNKVARGFIGGLPGNPGNFPATVKAGDVYKWDFVADVPSVPAGGTPVKMADVYLVGVVGIANNGYIVPVLNCVESQAGSGAESSLAVDGDPVAYTAEGQQATFKLTLDNTTSTDRTYNLVIEKQSLSPDGWLAQIVGGKKSITVKKSAKGTFSMDIFPGENIGNGNYKVIATDAADASTKLEASVEVVHTGAERLYIYSPEEDYDNLNELISQTEYDKFSSISISKIGDLTKLQGILAKFNKVKTAVISTADNFAFSATDIALLQYYNTAGVDILLSGTIALINKDVQSYLNSTFGFGTTKQFKIVNNDQEMPIEGISGDNLTNGYQASLTIDNSFPTSFTISDAAKATKTLVYSDSKTEIAGVKCDKNGTKLIALGFSFANMLDDQQRLELLEKSIYWLENVVASLKPTITVDKSTIAFGNTEVESTSAKTITITNTGNGDLSVEGLNITGADASAFSFVNMTFPSIIPPNENLVVMAKFTPNTPKEFTAQLNILSNDTDKPELAVELTGTGTSNSVETEAGFICSIAMTPNPVTTSSQVTYTTTGAVNAVIRINDAQGKVVAEVYNGILNSGTYNYILNTNNLSSGNYFMTAQFDGKWETIPFVIVK
jgi:hypothetical protein